MTDLQSTVRARYARHAAELPNTPEPPTLGLGDVVELAALRSGETVLDLGSGPGRDLLQAARAIGSSGRAIGVDFTPEMIERARRSAAEAELDNVTILEGSLDRLPLDREEVDVVISNCVINLTDDKQQVLKEAHRVLRPGGRLAILDTAFEQEPQPAVRSDADSWCACVAGALSVSDYRALLETAGFEKIELRLLDTECGEEGLKARALEVKAQKPATTPSGSSSRGSSCQCC